MNIKEILDKINIPKDSCEYWDIRIESVNKTAIKYEDYELTVCSQKPSLGAFLRVYHNGMWHYLSTTELSTLSDQVVQLSKTAKKYNKKSVNNKLRPYNLKATEADLIQANKTRMDKIALSEKKNLCEGYFDLLKGYNKLKRVRFSYGDEYKVKYFLSSTGVKYTYDFNQCGFMVSYSVIDGNDRFDDKFDFCEMEFSKLKGLDDSIKKSIEESYLFTSASSIEAGEYPVIMDSEVVGVFAHESFGHKSEADFMLGDEAAKETWKIGKKVGSEVLTIVDYGGEYGMTGYCPIDDEGFPAEKTYLIKNGILTGRLHSQYTSQVLNETPTGNGRAMNFEYEPIVRMTNTYVEPGELSFEEMISKVKLGIFAADIRHGSGLSTFTIAPRKCYMIRDGKIAEPVRVSVMSGTVFETLGRIEGCTKDLNIPRMIFGGCGKMEQWPLSVGFGGPKILVSKMIVS